MIQKIVLLIIAHAGFHPVEFGLTRKILEEAGIKVVVASDRSGLAHSKPSDNHAKICTDPNCPKVIEDYPQYAQIAVDCLIANCDLSKFDGFFIIGGPGAAEFLDTPETYAVMQKIAASGKPFGAICISPRILAHAGLLQDKKATGWNGDNKLEQILMEHGAQYIDEPVVIDGTLITANGPQSAAEFGTAIVTILKNE